MLLGQNDQNKANQRSCDNYRVDMNTEKLEGGRQILTLQEQESITEDITELGLETYLQFCQLWGNGQEFHMQGTEDENAQKWHIFRNMKIWAILAW